MNDDIYFSDFERDGEDVVRRNLALKLYQEKKAGLAAEWLSRKESSRRKMPHGLTMMRSSKSLKVIVRSYPREVRIAVGDDGLRELLRKHIDPSCRSKTAALFP